MYFVCTYTYIHTSTYIYRHTHTNKYTKKYIHRCTHIKNTYTHIYIQFISAEQPWTGLTDAKILHHTIVIYLIYKQIHKSTYMYCAHTYT